MTTATKREKILYSIKKNIEIFKENLKEDCDIDDQQGPWNFCHMKYGMSGCLAVRP